MQARRSSFFSEWYVYTSKINGKQVVFCEQIEIFATMLAYCEFRQFKRAYLCTSCDQLVFGK